MDYETKLRFERLEKACKLQPFDFAKEEVTDKKRKAKEAARARAAKLVENDKQPAEE